MRVALVTGASGGLGGAVVRALERTGWRVAGHRLANPLPPGGDLLEITADLTHPSAARELVRRVRESFGRLDLLVDCAGVTCERLLARTPADLFERVLELNLGSPFRLIRAVVPLMEEGGGGQILLVSSLAALRGRPGLSAYSAAKGALLGLAASAAREVAARGVRVNVIVPGFLMTSMGSAASAGAKQGALRESLLGRWGDPAETAGMIAALAGTRGITGQVFRLDDRA